MSFTKHVNLFLMQSMEGSPEVAQGSLSDSQRQTFPTDTFLAGLEAVFKRAMEPVAEN